MRSKPTAPSPAANHPAATAERSTRVAVIQAEIEAGTYVVDLDRLSQRILIVDIEGES